MNNIEMDGTMLFYYESHAVSLQPQGALDAEGSQVLQHHIAMLKPERHHLWILDLSQVDFINSAGLMALIASLNLSRQHRCRLVLTNLHPSIQLIFEITRLDQVFEIVDWSLDGSAGDPLNRGRATSINGAEDNLAVA